MFVVLFEAQPKPEAWDIYLAHAAALKPELERIEGFLDNERFRSLRRDGWLVSVSTWRDEAALIRWRAQPRHRAVQADGRARVFEDYRLRVGEVVAEPGPHAAAHGPGETASGEAKAALLVEGPAAALGTDPPVGGAAAPVAWDRFDSLASPGQGLVLSFWRSAAAALAVPVPAGCRGRVVRVLRDYGLFDRAEAPPFHPPVSRPGAGGG